MQEYLENLEPTSSVDLLERTCLLEFQMAGVNFVIGKSHEGRVAQLFLPHHYCTFLLWT